MLCWFTEAARIGQVNGGSRLARVHTLGFGHKVVQVAANTFVEEPSALLGVPVIVPPSHQLVPLTGVATHLAFVDCFSSWAARRRGERSTGMTPVVLGTAAVRLI